MVNIWNKLKKRLVRSAGKDIDYKTMEEMLKNERDIIVIDVRNKDEYDYWHIKGAKNIPLQDINKRINTVIKNKENKIIVYCEHGGRSKKACIKLEKMGYSNVYNLANGLNSSN